MNDFTDLSEIHISSVEHTEVRVQRDLFSSTNRYTHKNSVLNAKNKYCVSHSLFIGIDVEYNSRTSLFH